ncbi:ABC transporter substrate-binding protein [Galactobacter sp.]|uniref:ABC transporter substrate-binding protein n=1 Tax=Galactobacter sp. TaxID=2676125 RepID=UPI0025BF0ADC|nr:ABC transporter substrate-binding protein [Galactobacter sp.]
MHRTRTRRGLTTAAVIVASSALVLSGCASKRDDDSGNSSKGGDVNTTFTFAASSDPKSLDPAFASDGESFRVSRQIFEGLVGTEPGTADPAPLLAKEWKVSDDAKTFDFTLQEGVKFHDGSDFNAEAVCANFDRWYNFKGIEQTEGVGYYYKSLFKGYADKDTDQALYKSCEAKSDTEASVTLTQPWVGFISALSLPAFAMQSPEAMEKYGASEVSGSADAPKLSEYALSHPTGTGPFTFKEWKNGDHITLEANKDYWGEQGQVEKVVFRVIADATARKQALEANEIDGYDLVSPGDLKSIEDAGYKLINRDPFNVLYLGINSAEKELSDVKVRQAIAYAIDKEQLNKQVMPDGTKSAIEFIPDSVRGYTEDVETYDYDVDKAKDLLKEAGYPDGFSTTFYYPTDVSRPYMPTPADTYTNIAQQLEKVGIKVTPKPMKWTEYTSYVQGSEKHGLHLLGWTGDYNDTDNFVGVFFNGKKPEFGFENEQLFKDLDEARTMSDEDAQTKKYEDINKEISKFVPAVPLAHPVPTLAFNSRVSSYPASPVQDEVYSEVELSK